VNGKNKNHLTYSYVMVIGETYTYDTFEYTYPALSYTYDYVSTTATYSTNHYDAVLQGGQKYVASSIAGSKKILVTGGAAILVLPNGMDGAENIIMDHGAGITIYAGGSSVAISGNNVVNPSGYAGNFIVLCDPSVKSFTLNGNGEFTGVLVAPEADLVMNGGGSGIDDFCGSFMVNSVRLNGHYSFHYDEALGKGPSNGRFLITQWDEVK